jgi:hypothetical protein
LVAGEPGDCCKRKPGEEVWRLRAPDGRVQSCKLRDDSAAGAGRDVMMLENGEPLFSRRCMDELGAGFIAESFKQELMRTGWAEAERTACSRATPIETLPKSRLEHSRHRAWTDEGNAASKSGERGNRHVACGFLLPVAMMASGALAKPTTMKDLTFLKRDGCVNTPDTVACGNGQDVQP